MLKTFFFLLLLVSRTFSVAQEDDVENRFCIGISPLPLVNLYDGPSYQIGAEVKIYKNVSFSAVCGGYVKTCNTKFWWKENIVGFVALPEIKVYLNKNGLNNGKYVAAEYMYKKQDFDFWATINNDSLEGLTYYHVFKESSGVNIKYGELVASSERFVFEWFAGAGVCFVNGRDTLTDFQRENIDSGEGQGGLAGAYIRWTDKHTQPFITTGITLSFRVF